MRLPWPKYGGRDVRQARWCCTVPMPSGSTGHRLRYSWDDVAGTAHQMIARARRESAEYSRTSRSIGVSNRWHVLHAGACLLRGVGVRYVVIPCARERQKRGRAPRAWSRSLSRVCAAIWSSLGVSITGGMTLLLVPACFPSGMEAASCRARQYAGTGGVEEGQSSVCVCLSKRKYPFPYHKRKTIIFMVGRKKSNR